MQDISYPDQKLEKVFEKAFESIFKVFGEPTKETLLLFLEEKFSLTRTELVKKPDLLEQGLKRAFSAGGWMLIRQMLLKELYQELRIPVHEDKDWNLTEHLKNIQILLATRNVNY